MSAARPITQRPSLGMAVLTMMRLNKTPDLAVTAA